MRFSLQSLIRRWIRSLTGRVTKAITSRLAMGLKKSASAKVTGRTLA